MKEITILSHPPKKISKEIKFKIKEVAKFFGKNRSSIQPLAHFTLASPIIVKNQEVSKIYDLVRQELRKTRKPKVRINGWSWAPNKMKIFGIHLKIKKTDSLTKFHKRLEKRFQKYKKPWRIKTFVPHISLAWNMKEDMKKSSFEKAKAHLREKGFSYKREYSLDKVYIHERVGKNSYKCVKVIK